MLVAWRVAIVDWFHENLEMGRNRLPRSFSWRPLLGHPSRVFEGRHISDARPGALVVVVFQGPHVENQHFVSDKNGQKTGVDLGGHFLGTYNYTPCWSDGRKLDDFYESRGA